MAIPHFQIDEQHRVRAFAPVVICALGLLVTLVAGIFETSRQSEADQQQQAIASGVAAIARQLNAPVTSPAAAPAAAPDPALAAAAAKLANQAAELARLRHELGRRAYLPPNPDILYKGDVPVAVVEAATIDTASQRIRFGTALSHSDLDLTTPFLFRGWSIRCAAAAHTGTITSDGDRVRYWNLPCTIEP